MSDTLDQNIEKNHDFFSKISLYFRTLIKFHIRELCIAYIIFSHFVQ